MQIVIDITKEDYERLKSYGKAPFCSLTSRLYEAVANGTPLPKGHGRLIDADKLKKNYPHNTDWEYPVNTNSYVCDTIDDAPTINHRSRRGAGNMTFEEAKKIFLNRGIDDNGIYDGDKWRQSVRVISDYLENLPSAEMTDRDSISRQAVLDAIYNLCNTGETLKENPWRDNPHIDAITDAINDLPSTEKTGDSISRQAAIHLADELKYDLPDDMHLADMAMAHNEAILDYQTKISLLPSAEKTGWIPVTKAEPEAYGEFLISWVCNESKRPLIGYAEYEVSGEYDYEKNRFKGDWIMEEYTKSFTGVRVTAWQECPEPYREEGSGE